MPRPGLLLAPVLIALLGSTSGCLIMRFEEGEAVPWGRVDRIEPGRTTREEVLAWFGAPQNFSNPSALSAFLEHEGLEPESYAQYPFTDVFVYQRNRARVDGVLALLFNRFDVRMVSDTLLVMFDEAGTVEYVGTRRGPELE